MCLTKIQSVIGGLAIMLSWSTSYAERICVHGHSGMLQDPNTDFTILGSGLRIFPKDTRSEGDNWSYTQYRFRPAGSWVHYSIPVDSKKLNEDGEEIDKTYSRVRVRVTSGPWTYIDEVHVYAGETVIKTAYALDYARDGIHYIDIPLHSPGVFWNSIGVSIKATTDKLNTSRNYLDINSVCAFE